MWKLHKQKKINADEEGTVVTDAHGADTASWSLTGTVSPPHVVSSKHAPLLARIRPSGPTPTTCYTLSIGFQAKDVPKEWHDRMNRTDFRWQEPRWKRGTVSYEDWKSTWNSGVWKAIRRGSEEEEVRKHQDGVTGAWKQISKQRQRVNVSYNPSEVTAL